MYSTPNKIKTYLSLRTLQTKTIPEFIMVCISNVFKIFLSNWCWVERLRVFFTFTFDLSFYNSLTNTFRLTASIKNTPFTLHHRISLFTFSAINTPPNWCKNINRQPQENPRSAIMFQNKKRNCFWGPLCIKQQTPIAQRFRTSHAARIGRAIMKKRRITKK